MQVKYDIVWAMCDKKGFVIALVMILTIFVTIPCYAKNSLGHNEDIGYIIYGYENWNDFENATEEEKLSYYIVSDSAAFSIDEQGMGKNIDKYQNLKENIASTKSAVTLPHYGRFISLGGGNHRAYNHQGFVTVQS